MIRRASITDLSAIMVIIKDTIAMMHKENNPQWDSTYPQEQDFLRDIDENALFVYEEKNVVLGVFCINGVEPDEYGPLPWLSKLPAMVLHRMAIAPGARRQGIGKKVMAFVEDFVREKSIVHLKTDTYSENEKMNALFIKCGYQKIGEIKFRGVEKSFYCYEKILIEGQQK